MVAAREGHILPLEYPETEEERLARQTEEVQQREEEVKARQAEVEATTAEINRLIDVYTVTRTPYRTSPETGRVELAPVIEESTYQTHIAPLVARRQAALEQYESGYAEYERAYQVYSGTYGRVKARWERAEPPEPPPERGVWFQVSPVGAAFQQGRIEYEPELDIGEKKAWEAFGPKEPEEDLPPEILEEKKRVEEAKTRRQKEAEDIWRRRGSWMETTWTGAAAKFYKQLQESTIPPALRNLPPVVHEAPPSLRRGEGGGITGFVASFESIWRPEIPTPYAAFVEEISSTDRWNVEQLKKLGPSYTAGFIAGEAVQVYTVEKAVAKIREGIRALNVWTHERYVRKVKVAAEQIGEDLFLSPAAYEFQESLQKAYKYTGFPVLHRTPVQVLQVPESRVTALERVYRMIERGAMPWSGQHPRLVPVLEKTRLEVLRAPAFVGAEYVAKTRDVLGRLVVIGPLVISAKVIRAIPFEAEKVESKIEIKEQQVLIAKLHPPLRAEKSRKRESVYAPQFVEQISEPRLATALVPKGFVVSRLVDVATTLKQEQVPRGVGVPRIVSTHKFPTRPVWQPKLERGARRGGRMWGVWYEKRWPVKGPFEIMGVRLR